MKKGGKNVRCKTLSPRKLGVVILILNKVDFNTRGGPKNKKASFLKIKGSVIQEDSIILNYMNLTAKLLKTSSRN